MTSHAIQAIAFILLRDAGVDAVDACMALADGQAANQLARHAEDEATLRCFLEGMTTAVAVLKSGWLPEGWES